MTSNKYTTVKDDIDSEEEILSELRVYKQHIFVPFQNEIACAILDDEVTKMMHGENLEEERFIFFAQRTQTWS